jgi:FKBP-type peptidyl-prolyl cis-trans isomerase SlyD
MPIAPNSVVAISYKVATADGELVDQSQPGDPLTYLHGIGQIIKGLEAALEGKEVGDKVDTTISPEDGYGHRESGLDLEVPMEAFPKEAKAQIVPGFRFLADHPTESGRQVSFTVHEIEGETVRVSGNHPLAGQTLCFQVEIMSIRDASAEELAHGHVHGEGGHHH